MMVTLEHTAQGRMAFSSLPEPPPPSLEAGTGEGWKDLNVHLLFP